ncbi:hypothetical protein [Chryseobacterium daecheongense]|uniref:DUF748 domain-containing protein n=1 Tax=Chryseobacterium daecheongense TaxID=192389 RepID=A0A3N0VTK9_9FLAO|nr:hypothetical protein [Chryseobacterium daecheongense]ROH96157.1 hypothetical protein EGI05_16775 [Chryseobacterium daecheongense]TDX91428.1 hypothetical protein BCF50_2560 [Chryseobacterium daecheongense]
MKKWVKKSLIGLGVLLIIFLLANFGLNIWLKTQLPNYIKNNTDYKVSYKTLDVDLGTGNIVSTGISVNSKNPQNINVIGLQGTIDTLKISRFGIYDVIFNKQINSSDLLLASPNLNVILARPVDHKTGKKRNPVLFENIRINNGIINIFRHTKQKFLSVEQLDLFVENLQMTEESVENKLPVVFDKYDIKGKRFFFRPDNVYALKIDKITTSNGQMSVENFRLIPLLTFAQFKRFYPQKPKLFQFDIQKMDFKDVVLKKNRVSLANADFQNPVLSVYTTHAAVKKSDKPFSYEVNLDDIRLNNATVQILKPDGNKLFFARNLNVNVNQLKLDKETMENVIPVGYKDFRFSGKDIHFSNHQDINAESIALNPKSGEMRNISIIPNGDAQGKTSMNLTAAQIAFNINKWEFLDKKLNLDVKDVLVSNVNGTIKGGTVKSDKKVNLNGIQFPIIIRKVTLKNSNVVYDKGAQPLAFNDLNATINDIELLEKANKTGMDLKIKDYFLTTKNFAYKTKFYHMSVGLLKLNKNKVQVNNFAMKPLVSRAQFIKMIPVERDLYDLTANQVTADGSWDLFSQNKFINASNVTIQGADAVIFRSKIPKDDPKEKPLYSRMLRSIKFPVTINMLDLKNSKLVYEEDTPESAGPGKLTFSNFNMNVKNLNSAKTKGKPTRVDIKINCSFMNLAPLSVNWNFDVADQRDVFTISGRTLNLPAQGINPFIRPYLHVTATGTIQEMLFNFRGNPAGLNGTFNLKHKDLKVAILDKNNREKKGVLTAIANLVVRSNSGRLPEDVKVENIPRDPTKSFFNLFWKGIESGLKKTLIGKNVDKTEESVKNTVSAVKDMKQSVKELKEEVKNKKESAPKEEKKKKGLFKGIFNKKEKPETE